MAGISTLRKKAGLSVTAATTKVIAPKAIVSGGKTVSLSGGKALKTGTVLTATTAKATEALLSGRTTTTTGTGTTTTATASGGGYSGGYDSGTTIEAATTETDTVTPATTGNKLPAWAIALIAVGVLGAGIVAYYFLIRKK